ncbi:MAG: hypothetical protein E7012_01060 [Alphaproteobacteria bacterium]|nr:hypothetical protein [Alphaproteobacteria bacterium]
MSIFYSLKILEKIIYFSVYTTRNATLVYDRGWAWIVVFQALNYSNYAVVKYYNGKYSVVEV